MHRLLALACALGLGAATLPAQTTPELLDADICVYGATSAGVVAAVQATRMGRSVVLVEPGLQVGGLSSGGLGATDIGNKAAIGGLSRQFYARVAGHYARDDAWRFESREAYFTRRPGGQVRADDLAAGPAGQRTMWTFEPHVAESIFFQMLNEARVPLYLGQSLTGVEKSAGRITAITVAPGRRYRAALFIDASYEGDLMAAAGVRFTVGREPNRLYDETLNGIRPETPHHQFTVPVDPYRIAGDPASGRLPFIQPGDGGVPGDGDHRVQAYNYRLCFTTNAENRRPLTAPVDYNAADYELLARYLEALVAAGQQPVLDQFWHPIWMPNAKTDINNNGGFSTDFIGMNWDYPAADPPTRVRIAAAHERYIRGFLHFLATSPRVPANIREEMSRWGPAADEFPDTAGWPNQLYVREARRMISDCVMTEHHCRGQQAVPDPIGLAAYNMDSHNCQRIVRQGRVENEGDVQVPPMKPYPISYRAIVPTEAECGNLLVPVCLSASHIAYGSIRMEPVFMILGQSAATAAALALEDGLSVQKVPYPKLRARLLADHQVLAWTDPP